MSATSPKNAARSKAASPASRRKGTPRKPTLPKITVDRFIPWHEQQEERFELIGGVVYMSPSPGRSHQRVVRKLLVLLTNFLDTSGQGEVIQDFGCAVGRETFVVPDLAYYENEAPEVVRPLELQGAAGQTVPAWVIEVLSPSNLRHDLGRKKDLYERIGVQEYWIVDPDSRNIRIFAQENGGFQERTVTEGSLTTPLLPGFTLDLAELWRAVGVEPGGTP